MTDVFTPAKRSAIMSCIRGKDTKPEHIIRSLLHQMKFRFRLHRKDLPGTPDIVLPRHKKVVFIHGCFWHGHTGCKRSKRPTTNKGFWNRKIDGNIRHDRSSRRQLKAEGWSVLVLWQCQLHDEEKIKKKLIKFLMQ
jgi:DNA mismatch endonuclease (patch repair protein)